MSLAPSFQINLNQQIDQGKATVGRFDGKNPSLAASTKSGKLFIHSPFETDFEEDQIKFLNINKDVSALCSGAIAPDKDNDILLVGTGTSVLAYDVHANSELFFKEVPDGLYSMCFGKLGTQQQPMCVIGGNCAIQGFDHEGNEKYWTTTGGNVTCLEIADIDGDGDKELLVGSDDFNIYFYKNEEHIFEITQNDEVTGLCPVKDSEIAFALKNGSLGVYEKQKKIWKKTTKNQVQAIRAFDIDCDGVPEIICGMSNGKLEVRREKNGTVVLKDTFDTPISAIIEADYRNDGKEQFIACSYTGEVRGYYKADPEVIKKKKKKVSAPDSATQPGQPSSPRAIESDFTEQIVKQEEDKELEELNQKKNELLDQLTNYEKNIEKLKDKDLDPDLIDPKTKISCRLNPNQDEKVVEIIFEADNAVVIKAAIIRAEKLFEKDAKMIVSDNPTNILKVSLNPPKDQRVELRVEVFVGHPMAEKYHVFELNYTLPKFTMYLPVNNFKIEPKSNVTFRVKERKKKIALWLNNSFNVVYEFDKDSQINVKFVHLKSGEPLQIKFDDQKGEMTLAVDCMDTAGEIVQDFSTFSQIHELETVAEFPQELEKLKQLLDQVERYNASRLQLMADMGDSSQFVKSLVIKAEDARILGDMEEMRRAYSELYITNKNLIGEYIKRSNNQEELLSALKQVNQIIQNAAKLRVGTAKTNIINQCREGKNFSLFFLEFF